MTILQSKNPQPTKECYRCGRTLLLAQFNKNNQRPDGLTGNCKECLSEVREGWDRKYNQSEKARATARRYYYSEKGQEVKKAYRQKYEPTEEQKERYRAAERERKHTAKRQEQFKRYRQSEKGRAMKAEKDARYAKTEKGRFSKRKTEIKRRNSLKASDCTLTKEEWETIKAEHNHRCAYCGKKSKRLEMDHIIPVSRGGPHTMENIAPSCRKCNASKGNKLLSEINEAFGT